MSSLSSKEEKLIELNQIVLQGITVVEEQVVIVHFQVSYNLLKVIV
jgi:hypothetical protein